ncbi:aspartate carbamoyltransferase catalytic subunit [Thermosulfidibacter takaii ABI70S6]|uniref:Aspartate carbamoyltransferase n=2 Tax=Thermosulfidibacter takaii TaxID=412593 RepID=A0A0S3QTL6_THET7|nr:aspartate carbamoyltransferase catalytic subunit [Thermosulfidibacter takaii]BAT71680.1 aspartate carbamoyltransferase catalytic subunit [Thermosulfidibacter takaii ABI70S6]
MFKRKHLLGIAELEREEIEVILESASSMKEVLTREIKKVPTLRGKTVANLFFEPSTRTRTSFELAAKRLSADVVNFSSSGSSISKGETLKDTVLNIESMVVDAIVVRHKSEGVPWYISTFSKASVINAGDGKHEHPTQALLDSYTILEKKGKIEGLNIAIVGDITHSRVARSDIWAFKKLGANPIVVVGPPTLIPKYVEALNVQQADSIDQVISDVDVIIMLRIQKERMKSPLFPSIREYSRLFGLNAKKLAKAKPDVIVMHPGPVNWGVELSPDVMEFPRNVILDQVTNGVAVRMAVLYLLLGT